MSKSDLRGQTARNFRSEMEEPPECGESEVGETKTSSRDWVRV